MKDSNDYSETSTVKLRGKTAIDSAHKNTSIEDERRITNRISEIYGVTKEEASDIHTNYHQARIRNILRQRAKGQGMRDSTFEENMQRLNIIKYALSISRGELIEMAAGDILFKELSDMQKKNEGMSDDRYFNFYH